VYVFLASLRSDYYQGFRHQICIIDACANYIANLNEVQKMAAEGLPSGKPVKHREQLVLLAAKPGELAKNLTERQTGLFTHELMTALGEELDKRWPPDMSSLAENLDQRFSELRRQGIANQTPTYFWYRQGTSSKGSIGTIELTVKSSRKKHEQGSNSRIGHRNSLPRDVLITGRERETDYILSRLTDSSNYSVLAIDAVDGMAGIGKTALAVHAAHRMSSEYPEAQLFIDLHGYTAGQPPLEPIKALGSLLRMLGVAPERIPSTLDERAALWRSLLAELKAVIVLDNARSQEQIRPLLPGSPNCRVIITSRRRLVGLDNVKVLSLQTLQAHDAEQLLVELIGLERAKAEMNAVRRIAELSGFLPLAIHLAGNRLRYRKAWSLSFFAEKLADARLRLEALQAKSIGVAATFELSYSELSPEERTMFRRLGLHKGPSFTVHATAALYGSSERQAEKLLDILFEHHLVEETVAGRFQFHDLLRDYAVKLTNLDDPSDRNASIQRLMDYYFRTGYAADKAINPYGYRRNLEPADQANQEDLFTDRGQALNWLEAERLNLFAATRQADELGWHSYVCYFSQMMAHYLLVRGYTHEALELHANALNASLSIHDSIALALAHENMGSTYWEVGQFRDALTHFENALIIFCQSGDVQSEARLLDNIGFTFERTGEYATARSYLERSLEIRRNLSDLYGEAKTLNSLGAVYWREGNYSSALTCFEPALQIRKEILDQNGEMRTLNNIGFTFERLSSFPKSLSYLNQALELAEILKDRHVASTVYNNLGYLHVTMGKYRKARKYSERGLKLAREIGSIYEEARALDGIGRSLVGTGKKMLAADYFRQAMKLFEELGVPESHDIEQRLADL
jgi:tetratricopeptide (TPR) repeat protein